MKAIFKCPTLSIPPNLVVIADIVLKRKLLQPFFRHHCSSSDIYKSGQKWFKVVIKNFRDTSLYEFVWILWDIETNPLRRTLRARDHVARARYFKLRFVDAYKVFRFFLQEFVVFFSHFVVCHFPVDLLRLNLEFEPTIQGGLFLNMPKSYF